MTSFTMVSLIVSIGTIVYSVIHVLYDILTKSEFEKCITYRGKDRVLTGIFLFIIIVLLTVISTFDQIIDAKDEYGTFYSVILILGVSLALYLVALLIFSLGELVITLVGLYPTYEVKIFDDKEEYWRIYKVTKNNRVILKKDHMYLTFSSVDELDGKSIREQYNKRNRRKIKPSN